MRKALLIAALLASACSYSEETAQIFVHVDGIPASADHLDVVLTPSDTSVASKNCSSALTPAPASNAICYRPSFQPESLASGSLDLAFAQPAAAGTFTVAISASDRTQSQLAQGTVSGAMPSSVSLQVTLH
jgi:hypothetical protein